MKLNNDVVSLIIPLPLYERLELEALDSACVFF